VIGGNCNALMRSPQCLFGSAHRDAGRLPRPVLVAEQEAHQIVQRY
jgi:hypothetical protein